MTRSHRTLIRHLQCALLVAAATLCATAAAAQGLAAEHAAKLDTIARGRATQITGRSRVIVQFTTTPDVRVFASGTAGRRVGTRAQVGEIDNRLLATVAADARVARVMIDRPAFPTLERTGSAVGAALARDELGLNGKGVGVAIIDSGITSWHDDLYRSRSRQGTPRVVHFKDFSRDLGATQVTEPPIDDYGHGTHVAGIIAGNGFDSKGARMGIAPGADLIGLKVLDRDGHGYVSDVIAAIDYAVAVRSTYNIRVINLSVASSVVESYHRDPLTRAARRATDAGIIVVAAAGNLGRTAGGEIQFGGITSPGNAPWVLTVGAASHQGTARREDDVVSAFSSRGPTWIDFAAKPDIVAPGVGTESLSDPYSTLYAMLPEYQLNGVEPTWYAPYLSLSGTSMAAPVVTGTIALMLQANPALTPNAVKAILQYTAQARGGEHVLAQGAGLLNTRGAVRLATFFAAPQDGVGDTWDVIEGESIAWARHLIWGNYRVTGGIPLPGSSAWAPDVAWGDLTTRDGRAVSWGARTAENIVWSTAAGSDNIVWSTAAGSDNIVWSTAGSENIVWSTAGAENIVWSTARGENIVWSTAPGGDENIVWSTAVARNVVWGNDCGGLNCRNVIWGSPGESGVWGTASGSENIVWSTARSENIVWSTARGENIVWSTARGENIVWSTAHGENIVWSTGTTDQIVWPASDR